MAENGFYPQSTRPCFRCIGVSVSTLWNMSRTESYAPNMGSRCFQPFQKTSPNCTVRGSTGTISNICASCIWFSQIARHCHANTNNLFAARYQLYLPKREDFQARMDYIMQEEDKRKEWQGIHRHHRRNPRAFQGQTVYARGGEDVLFGIKL